MTPRTCRHEVLLERDCMMCMWDEIHSLRGERDELKKELHHTIVDNARGIARHQEQVAAEFDRLRAENSSFRSALAAIKDGGFPYGVSANITERMLKMVEIATDALEPVTSKPPKESVDK